MDNATATAKRKHNKAFYIGSKKRKRGIEVLSVGMHGVLITCNEREKMCIREAYNVLNEYADKLYGAQFTSQGSDHSANEEEDVEKALAKEKKEMQEEHRFQSVLSGANNVIFIKTNLPANAKSSELVHTMLTDILENGHKKTRYCMRFLPIATCCHANMEHIKETALLLFEDFFFADNAKPCKFSVVYKSRNNDSVHRDEIIAALAGIVMCPDKGHSVNLNNPDWTICVEIIKGICCLAVVRDFHKLKKYNIHEVQNRGYTVQPAPQGNKDTVVKHDIKTEKKVEKTYGDNEIKVVNVERNNVDEQKVMDEKASDCEGAEKNEDELTISENESKVNINSEQFVTDARVLPDKDSHNSRLQDREASGSC